MALDLRPDSPTFRRAFSSELSACNGDGMLVAPGCAHGLLTLTDTATAVYQIDCDYDPAKAAGVRWNDPAFAIAGPFPPTTILDRDVGWPDFPAGTLIATASSLWRASI